MPTYLVRIIGTRDLVGVFSANNIVQRIDIVDECTEPERVRVNAHATSARQRLGPAQGGMAWCRPTCRPGAAIERVTVEHRRHVGGVDPAKPLLVREDGPQLPSLLAAGAF